MDLFKKVGDESGSAEEGEEGGDSYLEDRIGFSGPSSFNVGH